MSNYCVFDCIGTVVLQCQITKLSFLWVIHKSSYQHAQVHLSLRTFSPQVCPRLSPGAQTIFPVAQQFLEDLGIPNFYDSL